MNVVYVPNETYTRRSAVSFVPLCDRNPDEERLTAYLLDTGARTEAAGKLQALVANFGREPIPLPHENLEERFPEWSDTGGFNLSTLRCLLLGELSLSEAKRVLYLDCDTVVQQNLRRMYTVDLRGALLAMVEGPTIYHEVKAYLRILSEASYFNIGIMPVDLARQRAEDISRRLLDYCGSIVPYCLFQSQDAINGLLRGRITTLHPAYNFTTNYYCFSYASLEVFSPAYRKVGEWRFEVAEHHPAILHYTGDERPWQQGTYSPYGRVYLCYLARTPWKDATPEGDGQAYLLCYYGMNPLTRYFSSFRSAIGRRYVEKSAEERRWKTREVGKV